MENQEPKFWTINYFLKMGGYTIIAFPICDTILNRINLDKIFIFELNILWLSIFIGIILGIFSATVHNMYNYIKLYKKNKEIADNTKKEFENLSKKYNGLDNTYKNTLNKYNNLCKDYNYIISSTSEIINTIFDIIQASIIDGTDNEKRLLEQIYKMIDVRRINMNKMKGENKNG